MTYDSFRTEHIHDAMVQDANDEENNTPNIPFSGQGLRPLPHTVLNSPYSTKIEININITGQSNGIILKDVYGGCIVLPCNFVNHVRLQLRSNQETIIEANC